MARPRKNNADYFSHDNNMRNHRKIKALRNTFGMEGYGVFNMFLETQTECDKCKIKLSNNIEWEILAADFSVECQKLKDIVEYCIKIGLIEKERDCYFSENLIERLSPILELREKKREWANKRWDNDTETELKTPKTKLKNSETMQTKLNKTKLKISKDIALTYEEPLRETFNTKAKTMAKLGIPYMAKKKTSAQELVWQTETLARYIKDKAMEILRVELYINKKESGKGWQSLKRAVKEFGLDKCKAHCDKYLISEKCEKFGADVSVMFSEHSMNMPKTIIKRQDVWNNGK